MAMMIDFEENLSWLLVVAFDMVLDPNTALNDVIEIGFERLLTSGLDSTALEGLDTLKTLVEKVCHSHLVMT